MTSKEKEYFLNVGFTKEQIEEIAKGKEAGVQTALYANKNFLPIQMRQIRIGLIEKLPAQLYSKVEYDWFQMEEIRLGLKSGVDVSRYAHAEIPYEKMRQLRKGLEAGINLQSYMKLDAGVMRQLRKGRVAGINLLKYINEGYDAEQLNEIRYSLENQIHIDPYLSKEYRAASITQISKGLARGVDVALYASIQYNWRQMREIRKGLENRIDVEKYRSPYYSWEQMRTIRIGLEQGFDVESYRLLRYTAEEMQRKLQIMQDEANREKERILQSQIKSDDFQFDFGANDMEAFAMILTKDKSVTKARMLEILEFNGICKGLMEEAIDLIVNGEAYKKSVLIARGKMAEKGKDGEYEYFFNTDTERKPKVLEDGSVDYQNINWFEMVKQGQKLAVYHPAQEGTDGYTVRGEVLKARKGAEKRILMGQGFVLNEDKVTYQAAIDGMVRLENEELKVTSHLVLDEINLATGNIQFNGSIHIRGDIGYGTVVRATDDIVIEGTVEAATIESDGSIVLKKGMNSAGRGMIHAGKDVVSRFFESAKVTAKGNIEVDKCLNSQLYAGGMISSTRVIAGGVAQAESGFDLNNVGNQAGLHTVLKVKMNAKMREENRMVKVAIQEVRQELAMLNNSYEEYKTKFPPEVRNNMEIFKKIEKAVYTKAKHLEQFLKLEAEVDESLKKTREARVIIKGQAFEGTVLEMEEHRWEAGNQYNITVKKHDGQMEVINN